MGDKAEPARVKSQHICCGFCQWGTRNTRRYNGLNPVNYDLHII